MRNIMVIARHEYLTNIRRTGFILMTVLVPLFGLLMLLAAALFGGQLGQTLERELGGLADKMALVDQQGSFSTLPPEYADRFVLLPDEEAARAAVRNSEYPMAMVITPDYLETGRVVVLTRESAGRTQMLADNDYIKAFFVGQLLHDQVSPALQRRVANPLNIEVVDATAGAASEADKGVGNIMAGLLVPYLLGLLLVITIFVSSGYLLQGIAEEKSSRVVEIVVSSVSATEMLAGKIIGLGALGLTQIAIWLAATFGLSTASVGMLGFALPVATRPEIYVLAVVYYILGFLIYATLMGVASALGTSQQESQQLGGMLSMFAAAPFFLAGFVIQNPNMMLARIFSWFPLTGPSMMLLRLPMGRVPWIDVAGSIVMALLAIPLLLWLGAKIFRMGLLMYGKRASVGEIWQALRRA